MQQIQSSGYFSFTRPARKGILADYLRDIGGLQRSHVLVASIRLVVAEFLRVLSDGEEWICFVEIARWQ
jgi:inhibitor of KinA sporulation pathway (predicted exonuclease)